MEISKTRKLVFTAMFAALTCVATLLIKIPSPLKGYINLGDCMVLLSGWMLSTGYGAIAAGVGSAMADIFSGYAIYAPATFIIKGGMAIVAHLLFSLINKRINGLLARIISGISAEIIMVMGYYLFEGFMYGFVPSLVNILPNALQGVIGITLGIIMMKIFNRLKTKDS